MEVLTRYKRSRIYDRLESAVFEAEQAARELVYMDELQPAERETARKFAQELNAYNKKIGIVRRAQQLSGRSAKINIYDEITQQ